MGMNATKHHQNAENVCDPCRTKRRELSYYGLFQKKKTVGVEDMEFPGVLKN